LAGGSTGDFSADLAWAGAAGGGLATDLAAGFVTGLRLVAMTNTSSIQLDALNSLGQSRSRQSTWLKLTDLLADDANPGGALG
jgi:hypothetical protein